ncbi:MAG TPA: Xaa-Pro peptidase family protein [bacterium]|nr:Xaa-Pro peptidase family protein [bacterium]HPS30083.1 Xaa-Pro peptidase family protein [bacterium]
MINLFDSNELQNRASAFGRKLTERKIDCALLTSNQDLFYFTGSVQKGAVIINKSGEISYFVRKNSARAELETSLPVKEWNLDEISKITNGVWSMPYDVTSVSEHLFYKNKFSKDEAVDCSVPLALTKTLKSPQEIGLIKKAGIINLKVMEFAKTVYQPGIRDIDIQAEIELYAKKELEHQGLFWIRGSGMEAASMSLVVTGTDALEPTYTDFPIGGTGLSPAVAQGASRKIVFNNFVIDLIGCCFGYCADSTRTFFVQEPDIRIKKIYVELNDLMKNITDRIKPGTTGDEIYSFAMNLVEKYSWKDLFMGYKQKVRFIGHGIGTEVNQLPVIAPKQKTPFENSMVIAIEPKIFVPDYGIVGIENTYVLENNGLYSITGNCDNIKDWII